jgi:hypothetical protein
MATRERGAIGKQTFQRVQELVSDGTPKQTAFARVAEETGRSKQTVQTAFYRVARTMPGGGGVKQRPRKRSRSAPASGARAKAVRAPSRAQRSSPAVDALLTDLHSAIDALGNHVRTLEADIRGLHAHSERLDKIRKVLKS